MSTQKLNLPKIFCSKGGLHDKELINQICLNQQCIKSGNFLLCIACSDVEHDGHETIPAKLLLSEIVLSLDKSPDNLYRKFEEQKYRALRTLSLLRNDFEVYLQNLEEKINNLYQQIQNNITEENFQFASNDVLHFVDVLQKSRSLDEIKESLKSLLDRINIQDSNGNFGINLMNKAKKSSIILDLSSKQQEIFNSINLLSKDLQNIFEKNQIQITKISTETDLNLNALSESKLSNQLQQENQPPLISQSDVYQQYNCNNNSVFGSQQFESQIKQTDRNQLLNAQSYSNTQNDHTVQESNQNKIADFISDNLIPCPKQFENVYNANKISQSNNKNQYFNHNLQNSHFQAQNQYQIPKQNGQNTHPSLLNYKNPNEFTNNVQYQQQYQQQQQLKQSQQQSQYQQQLQQPEINSIFTFSEEQSHPEIQVKNNIIKNNRYYAKEQVYRICTLLPSLQQSLPKVQTWTYKILDCLPSWIGFGIGHIKNIKENQFQYKRNDFSLSNNSPLNHGLYMITSNGFAFKNQKRPEKTNLSLSKGDTLTIRFDPYMNLLIFYKNFDSTNPYNMEFKTELGNKLYPLVILWYPNDEVMLL